MQKRANALLSSFVVLVMLANLGLFLSTATQVGFAHNLHVPTVPPNITMTSDEAYVLSGLAARDWAAGAALFLP